MGHLFISGADCDRHKEALSSLFLSSRLKQRAEYGLFAADVWKRIGVLFPDEYKCIGLRPSPIYISLNERE